MNKKVVIGLIIAVIVVVVAIVGYTMYKNSSKENSNSNLENDNLGSQGSLVVDSNEDNNVAGTDENVTTGTDEEESDETGDNEVANTETNGGKTLVVYYSAQNHTKAVSEKIAKNLDADLFEIVPEEVYSNADLNWTDSNSRVSREHNDESLRDVKLVEDTVDNWDEYDTVLIGYPIWWGIAAWPVDTFVKANDFEGKTVIPFCTSTSSGLGQSGKLLEEEAKGGEWLNGQRFRENPSDSDISRWTDSIK